MKWTSEKPTKPGYYWYRSKHYGDAIMELTFDEKTPGEAPELFATCKLGHGWVERLLGQWAGPIEEPTE